MSNFDIEDEARRLKIKNWRGVFMRDNLPSFPKNKERAVINLDGNIGAGTHWTCYDSSPEKILYFDSFGLPPPKELVNYLRKRYRFQDIKYNTFILQSFDSSICGQLCLFVLKRLSDGEDFLDILLNLY